MWAQIIGSVVGIFSSKAKEDKYNHNAKMAYYDRSLRNDRLLVNSVMIAEFMIPVIVIVLIVFVIKKYK